MHIASYQFPNMCSKFGGMYRFRRELRDMRYMRDMYAYVYLFKNFANVSPVLVFLSLEKNLTSYKFYLLIGCF